MTKTTIKKSSLGLLTLLQIPFSVIRNSDYLKGNVEAEVDMNKASANKLSIVRDEVELLHKEFLKELKQTA